MKDSPDSESATSIVLTFLFVVSIGCSVYVTSNILNLGVRTPHASLVLYLNLACVFRTLSKFPFIYDQIPHACAVVGPLYWYCAFLMQIVSFFMISSVNLKMLMTSEPPSNITTKLLNWKTRFAIFVVPALTVIYPLLTRSYVRVYHWCDVSRGRDSGIISRTIFITMAFTLQVITIYKLIIVTWRLRSLPPSTLYDDMFRKLFRGPGTYPLVGMLLTLVTDAIVIFEHAIKEGESNTERYYLEYALLVVSCLFGILFSVVYVIEKANIKAFELYFKDMLACEEFLLEEKDSLISSALYNEV